MNKFNKTFKYIIYFLLVFMPFREVIGIYDNVYLKFIPDICSFSIIIKDDVGFIMRPLSNNSRFL